MKKFNFPLERMLNYQEQDLEKAETYGGNGRNTVRTGKGNP